MLDSYQQHLEDKFNQFKQTLLTESPIKCDFKVGDYVTFTNENEVFFRKPKRVIGFDDGTAISGNRFIYTEGEAYWFPSSPHQLATVEVNSTGCLIVRELTHLSLYQFESSWLDSDWNTLVAESSLHCVWINEKTTELVTYCEGDVIWTTALDKQQFELEIRRVRSFFGIDFVMEV